MIEKEKTEGNEPIEYTHNEFEGLVVFPIGDDQIDLWNQAIDEANGRVVAEEVERLLKIEEGDDLPRN